MTPFLGDEHSTSYVDVKVLTYPKQHSNMDRYLWHLVGDIPTPLKNSSQLGLLSPIYGKIKSSKPPTRHHFWGMNIQSSYVDVKGYTVWTCLEPYQYQAQKSSQSAVHCSVQIQQIGRKRLDRFLSTNKGQEWTKKYTYIYIYNNII